MSQREGPGFNSLVFAGTFDSESLSTNYRSSENFNMKTLSLLLLSFSATRTQYCPGVVYLGKCYQFFPEPRRAVDAELFCQTFPDGHLASITNYYIHREVVSMMLSNSRSRTWIGGIRLLESGHFIWLDGSRWSYTDWLAGEPNNTADLEDCVELLQLGNGKFNDFTCWEPQSFVCSYTLY